MSTIFDYLKEVTYDSIYDRPFKELDVLALTELTYLPFGHIVPQGDTTGIPVRLSDAMELIDRTTDFIVSNQHLQLVDELATSKRFKTSNSSTMSMNTIPMCKTVCGHDLSA